MSKLDLTKPVQLENGFSVALDHTNLSGSYPLQGVVTNHKGKQIGEAWSESGCPKYCEANRGWDLVNTPEKLEGFMIVYRAGDTILQVGTSFDTLGEAREFAASVTGSVSAIDLSKVELIPLEE